MSTSTAVYYSDPTTVMRLVRYLPCFYDINVTTCAEILQAPVTAFMDARRVLKVDNEWPFNQIRQGKYRLGWCEVRYCRAMAILNHDTPSNMRECLVMAEHAAVAVRRLYMTRGMQDEMLQRVFPELPMLDELLRKENACFQMRHIENRERLHQVMDLREILHLLTDLPVKVLCTSVLRMSSHTLMEVRKTTDFAHKWPLPTMEEHKRKEVARQREAALAELNPKSYKAQVLQDAARLASTKSKMMQETTRLASSKAKAIRRVSGKRKKQAPSVELSDDDELDPESTVEAGEAGEAAEEACPESTWEEEEYDEAGTGVEEPLASLMHQAVADMVGVQDELEAVKGSDEDDDLHFFDNFEFSVSQEEERQYWEGLAADADET